MNPELKGKPVVTGRERGIVSAASYEAKAFGVQRGVPLWEVRKLCPDVIVVSSDYESYSIFSKRMFAIIRRFTSEVEEYGIDEGFADLTGLRGPMHMSYPSIAHAIKTTVEKELGITVSLGLAPSKVLAKVGSKWNKPSGFVVIARNDIDRFLRDLPAGDVWGIGPQTAAHLKKYGIHTASAFAAQPQQWVKDVLNKPQWELWSELNGRSVMPIETAIKRDYKSISKTKTFTPPSTDREYVFAQLSKNIENAFIKLRRHALTARKIAISLKTQDFRYHGLEATLNRSTAFPKDVYKNIRPLFEQLFTPDTEYRATGVWLTDIRPRNRTQLNLFEPAVTVHRLERLYASMDELAQKYGKHTVFHASSMKTHRSHAQRKFVSLPIIGMAK